MLLVRRYIIESRAFIKAAKVLTERVQLSNIGSESREAEREKRDAIQKDLNQLFGGLANPTLPSAFRLRDVALSNGFTISPATREKLGAFENWSC